MTPIPKTIIHLLSGGLDSVVLLYDLVTHGAKVHCVLFDYKQRHVQELLWAKHHCKRLNVLYTTIELPQLLGSKLTDGNGGSVVPFRNPLLLSHAVNIAVEAKADEITIACNSDDKDNFNDCKVETIDAMNMVIKLSGYNVRIVTPYIYKTKSWIASLGQDLGVSFYETWSCYSGGVNPCGICLACIKREESINDCNARHITKS